MKLIKEILWLLRHVAHLPPRFCPTILAEVGVSKQFIKPVWKYIITWPRICEGMSWNKPTKGEQQTKLRRTKPKTGCTNLKRSDRVKHVLGIEHTCWVKLCGFVQNNHAFPRILPHCLPRNQLQLKIWASSNQLRLLSSSSKLPLSTITTTFPASYPSLPFTHPCRHRLQ